MERKRASDRFQIPLMYAFRDAFDAGDSRKRVEQRVGGERVLSSRVALARRGTDEAQLRRNLVVDLLALVNTTNLGSALDLAELEYASRSVLNFGVPDLIHLTSDEAGVDELAQNLATALARHEPRLNPETLVVERDESFDDVNQRIRFNISAEMACKPLDVPVEFVAEIDIGSGKVQLTRLPVTA